MIILGSVECKFMFLQFQFVSDGGQCCFFEENFRGRGLLVLNCFGDVVISQAHRPVEVALGDVALV